MTLTDITFCRMVNQKLFDSKFRKPEQVVNWFVAMQAQELPMVKWALALRIPGLAEAEVDKSFNAGKLLRTHIMRPTWHFVSPDDIRWMIELTAPRVNAANAFMYRKLELETKLFNKTGKIIVKALENGKHLKREELQATLAANKINAEGLRLTYIVMQAELDGLICSGPKKGNQFTYALLDERAPKARKLNRDEALGELAFRYFRSRTPATVNDFSYWSGLTIKDAKEGVALNGNNLVRKRVDNRELVFCKDSVCTLPVRHFEASAMLMPDYDELGMSYKDRSSLLINIPKGKTMQVVNGAKTFNHMLLLDGAIAGMWQRNVELKSILIRTGSFLKLTKSQLQLVNGEVKKYGNFFGKKSSHEKIKVTL